MVDVVEDCNLNIRRSLGEDDGESGIEKLFCDV